MRDGFPTSATISSTTWWRLSGREVARHERLTVKGAEALVLDHHLEALMHKPGALAGSTVLEQARAAGAFTGTHEALWAAAATGEPAATRMLIEVLLLHRHMDDDDVAAGIRAALSVGALTADVIAVEARQAADARDRCLRHRDSAGASRPRAGCAGHQPDAAPAGRIARIHLAAAECPRHPEPPRHPRTGQEG